MYNFIFVFIYIIFSGVLGYIHEIFLTYQVCLRNQMQQDIHLNHVQKSSDLNNLLKTLKPLLLQGR